MQCPNGHAGCTANKNPVEPLSERELGYEIGEKLCKKKLLVKHITTDGDATSAAGLEKAIQNLLSPMWKTTRLADRIHRGQSQFRQGVKAIFSKEMFPGKTKAQNSDIQKMFANDIKERCHGVLQALFKTHNGNLQKISRALPRVAQKVLSCYTGKCSEACRYGITLCRGGVTTSWWHKSVGFNAYNLKPGDLKFNDQDKLILESLIEMKLSVSALNEMKLNSNTNKCESVNRTISVSLPKNKTYSRNAKSRALSGIFRSNNGIDIAVCKTMSALNAPLGLNSSSLKSLKKMKQVFEYKKKRKKSPLHKKRQAISRRRTAADFVKSKQSRKKPDYCKDKLEPRLSIKTS